MGCATGVVKNIVFVLNFLCAIVGLALLTIGAIAYINIKDSKTITNQDVTFVPILILSIGVVIFVISFLGCWGVCQKNQCMLRTYSVILLVLFVMQLSVSIYGYVQISKNEVDYRKKLETGMFKAFNDYSSNKVIKQAFNTFQTKLHCCGIDGPQDYIPSLPPISCCKPRNTTSNVCKNPTLLYTDGCANKVFDLVYHEMKIVMYVALGICAVELLGAIFAIYLANSYSNEERRFKSAPKWVSGLSATIETQRSRIRLPKWASNRPNLNLPNVNLPNVNLPNVNLPNVNIPNLNLPNVNLPNTADLPSAKKLLNSAVETLREKK